MQLGLLAFACQCVIVAFSTSPFWIFVSVLFSMLANLVYPSLSSLVSKVRRVFWYPALEGHISVIGVPFYFRQLPRYCVVLALLLMLFHRRLGG